MLIMSFCSRLNVPKLFHFVQLVLAGIEGGKLFSLARHQVQFASLCMPHVRLFSPPLFVLLQYVLLLLFLPFGALIGIFIFHNFSHWGSWSQRPAIAHVKVLARGELVSWSSTDV